MARISLGTLALIAVAQLSVSACTVRVNGAGEPKTPAAEPAPAPTPTTAPTQTPPPAQASGVKAEGDSIKLPGNIVFDTAKATLKEGSGSEVVLEQLRLFLLQNPRITKIRIEGHTDNVGQPADNLELSGQRALTIKRWLIAHEIPKERLIAVGFGQERPIASNATEEGKAQNRRTEFKIAELKGKPYLGMDPTAGGTVFDM